MTTRPKSKELFPTLNLRKVILQGEGKEEEEGDITKEGEIHKGLIEGEAVVGPPAIPKDTSIEETILPILEEILQDHEEDAWNIFYFLALLSFIL